MSDATPTLKTPTRKKSNSPYSQSPLKQVLLMLFVFYKYINEITAKKLYENTR